MLFGWWMTGLDMAMLGLEAQGVIAQRMAMFALGGPAAQGTRDVAVPPVEVGVEEGGGDGVVVGAGEATEIQVVHGSCPLAGEGTGPACREGGGSSAMVANGIQDGRNETLAQARRCG